MCSIKFHSKIIFAVLYVWSLVALTLCYNSSFLQLIILIMASRPQLNNVINLYGYRVQVLENRMRIIRVFYFLMSKYLKFGLDFWPQSPLKCSGFKTEHTQAYLTNIWRINVFISKTNWSAFDWLLTSPNVVYFYSPPKTKGYTFAMWNNAFRDCRILLKFDTLVYYGSAKVAEFVEFVAGAL